MAPALRALGRALDRALDRLRRPAVRYAALEAVSPAVALAAAGVVAAAILVALEKPPGEVLRTLVKFSFGRSDSVATILFRATPLMFSGLAVAVGFRAGLFNIGVEGQYLIGAFFAALGGFLIRGLPGFIHLPLVVALAVAGGMAWAWLPAWLKVRRGAHEVITTIMLNYVAFSLIHYFIADVFIDRDQGVLPGLGSPRVRMPKLEPTALMPTLHPLARLLGWTLPGHVYLNGFFLVGLALAAAIAVYLWRTPGGLEIRAVGLNPDAAGAAGIDVAAVRIRAFLLSGAMAGFVGLSDLLGFFGYLDIDFPKGYGFTGIAVALLGRNHPAGILLAALLFAFLQRGAEGVQAFQGVPMETIVILQGVIILAIVIAGEVTTRAVRRLQVREEARARQTEERAQGAKGTAHV